MAQTINTNVASLNAQRQLNSSQSSLATSLQRLSSGLRINSAKDDAAGMAISERFSTQIRGLNQAIRNANDGISLSQTAEGALSEVNTNLQRIRELAVQSSNASNSASDRAALQSEVNQRLAEITRVGGQTEFNGLKLLDGSFKDQAFQVGANAGQTISIANLVDARASSLGNSVLQTGGTGAITGTVVTAATGLANNAVAVEANLTISTTDASGKTLTTGAISYAVNSGANAIAKAINAAGTSVGVQATASNETTISDLSVAGTVAFTLNTTDADGVAKSAAISAVIADKNDLSALVSAINGQSSTTGITAEFDSTGSKSSIKLVTTDGRNIGIQDFSNTGTTTDTVKFGGTTLTEGTAVSAVKTGTLELTSSVGSIKITNGDAGVFGTAANSSFNSLAAIDITSFAGSQAALKVVDAALGKISSSRADLGAFQNRFESTIANLQTSTENLSASRGRIIDADFASETANLSRAQILQQAGTAMLAQANSLPQNVLSLLRG